jgi:hypothetical protein
VVDIKEENEETGKEDEERKMNQVRPPQPRLAFKAGISCQKLHQENAVFTCFFTFRAFSLLASKKSSDTRKYFLGAFSSFGKIGLAFHKSTLLWKS